MEEGSSIGVTFQTAWHALKTRARVQPGETVVVQSAGSGVSVAAIQIAKHMGTRVIATASTGEKVEKALSLGADEAFNYQEKDFLEEVQRLTDGKGAEVILEPLTGPDFYQKVRALASWTGRIVVLGLTLGDIGQGDQHAGDDVPPPLHPGKSRPADSDAGAAKPVLSWTSWTSCSRVS